MQSDIKIYEDNPAVAAAFAEYLKNWLDQRGVVHIALSGGSTPKLLFDLLADQYMQDIKWEQIHFYWGDERCVPPDDSESNFKTANDLLLKNIVVPPGNIHRIQGEDDPAEEAKRYSQEIINHVPATAGRPTFDLIILGMGADGHTASIFPDQMELLRSDQICEVATHPETGQKRVTLTGRILNNALQTIFLVTGSSKSAIVKTILGKEEGYLKYPAAHVHPSHGELAWFLDEAAASDWKAAQ
ncbi:MAG: 6-phosphogluconolactonase [Saprospiraceae bacterium]|nr:6-phosphogluconolactonase [Saprospiraceae bacterium]